MTAQKVKKKAISADDLRVHLDEQLDFLRSSNDLFDSGRVSEFKRLAVGIRTLVHDTPHSSSLLGQLNRKGGRFISTASPLVADSFMSHWGVVGTYLGNGGAQHIALLDDAFECRFLPFEDWWHEIVVRAADGQTLTRQALVLTAANQDGGAHVDAEIDQSYADLKHSALGCIAVRGDVPSPDDDVRLMLDAEKVSIRQIAHEVLKTLVPSYRQRAIQQDGVFLAGASLQLGAQAPPPRRPQKFGRNEPCPCGSGQKYKKCHGALATL